MNSRKFAIPIAVAFIACLGFAYLSDSIPIAWYRMFYLNVTEVGSTLELTASPGDEVIVKGTITNTGRKWLLQMNMSAEGLPWAYTFTPSYFNEISVIGGGSSPQSFTLKFTVPQDAKGTYNVKIFGQELFSAFMVKNSTSFVLNVFSAQVAEMSIADTKIPNVIISGEPFDLVVTVKNTGQIVEAANVSVAVPSTWGVLDNTQYLGVEPNKSREFKFTIIPSGNAGDVVVSLEYPQRGKIIRATKTFANVTPQSPGVISSAQSAFERISAEFSRITGLAGGFTPILVGVVVLVIVLVFWKVATTYKFKVVRGEEEKLVDLGEAKIEAVAKTDDAQPTDQPVS